MSIKALHREIMLSAVYQLSADNDAGSVRQGRRQPALLARQPPSHERRADSRLACCSSPARSTCKIGGPSVTLTPLADRRTVYGKVSRYKLDEFLQLFDFPSPSQTAEQRFTTNVPLQRLFFMNSDFMQQQAERLAEQRRRRAGRRRADPEGVSPHLRPRRRPPQKSRPAATSCRPRRCKQYEERRGEGEDAGGQGRGGERRRREDAPPSEPAAEARR